ncbi:MAG TPA: VWA domain-containing protein [Terriglobia bacterium]|nr:VWA domain-containing protein [Terriglobia bacterium]
MMKSRAAWIKIIFLSLAFLVVSIPGGNTLARAQTQEGPAAQPGETPAIPKPAQQQGPEQQPGEAVPPKRNAPPPEPAPSANTQKINPNQVYTLSTTTNLVNVDVRVEDNSGDPIKNLQKTNFQVYDDGVQQTVTNFGQSQAPMTICMVVEFSNEYWPLVYQSLTSAYAFIQVMQPKDYVAVIYFDLKPHILTDFTHDKMQVGGALRQLVFPGFSEDCLYDALAFTIDRMKDIQGRKAILAIVSGFDTFSKLTYGDMLKIAKSSTTPIYAVSILEWVTVRTGGENINTEQARNSLNYISQYSGGQAYFPRFEAELPGIYQQIGDQLRSEYSVGFVPTDPERNGKFHKLKIDVVDAQGNPLRIVNQKGKAVKYHVVFRPGYYAPKG